MTVALQQAAELIRRSAHAVALTGAGISTPSGIPDFRSTGSGLWNQVDPLEVATIWAFYEHPERFYRWIRPVARKLKDAQPNAAHRALAALEMHHLLHAVLTQNVDSLHQRAGSRRVIELHGHARSATCLECGHQVAADALWAAVLAGRSPEACPRCSGLLKPDVILFGEPLPYAALCAAQQEALTCDLMLVIGTSLEVMPAADLPLLARRHGARLILINREPTPYDAAMEVVIRADVARTLAELARMALA
ncbi:MAG: SIR2 family NAD-dependent protein deacylase, partial [Anaerolineae bacterium]